MKSSHGVVEANDRIYLGVKAYNKELEEKIKELFGKSMENVFRDSQKSEKGFTNNICTTAITIRRATCMRQT